MTRKRILMLLGSVCLALAMVVMACAAPAPTPAPTPTPTPTPAPSPTPAPTQEIEVYKWEIPLHIGRGLTAFDRSVEWAERVKEASGGRLDITFYGDGELMPREESFEALSKGVIDFLLTSPGLWVGKDPVFGIAAGLPFTIRNAVDYLAVYHVMGLKDVMERAYAEFNIQEVRAVPAYDSRLLTKKPVWKVDDLKGMKIRCMGEIAEVMTAAGAATVYFPGGEVYGALEKGVCDGVVFGPLDSSVKMGFHEHTNSVLWNTVQAGGANQFLANMDSWNALPDDLKQILYLAAGDYIVSYGVAYFCHDDMMNLEKVKRDYGFTVTHLPEEELKKLTEFAKDIYERYATESPYFAEGWEIVKTFMRMAGY